MLTLEAADLSKRTQLPPLNLKLLCNAVLASLHADLGVASKDEGEQSEQEQEEPSPATGDNALRHHLSTLEAHWSTISTLDPVLDASLHGGVPTGYITEVSGEAGAGKTQLLLALLLAVQLPPPHGTGRNALYISTEAPLQTRRLTQMLAHNPVFAGMAPAARPSLDNILSTTTPDLESQDHILTYQVPVEVARRNIGLVVLDSVAANYRAEFDRKAADALNNGGGGSAKAADQGSNMAARSAELVRLGMHLRELARTHNLAVVVSNQVADRFELAKSQQQPPKAYKRRKSTPTNTTTTSTAAATRYRIPPEALLISASPLASRSKNPDQQPPLPPVEPTSSMADALPRSSLSNGPEEEEQDGPPGTRPPPPPLFGEMATGPPIPAALNLDHQSRWFTGWGDDPYPSPVHPQKTPSLGLVWATQIACRVALYKAPRYGRSRYAPDDEDSQGAGVVGGGGTPTLKSWRRWLKVVFAPHVAAAAGPGVEGATEFEIHMGGLRGVVVNKQGKKEEKKLAST